MPTADAPHAPGRQREGGAAGPRRGGWRRSSPSTDDDVGALHRALESVRAYLADNARLADAIAHGDLRADEVAPAEDDTLRRALHNVRVELSAVFEHVRSATAALAAASAQVSSTSQTVSQGTAAQAASVDETTTSMEEINASISQNAENSRVTEQLALKGAADAEESGRAVNETVDAMKTIAGKISNCRRDRVPDESARAQRRRRGRAGRRARTGVRRRRHRGAQARGAESGRCARHRLARVVEPSHRGAIRTVAPRLGPVDPQDRGARTGGRGGVARTGHGRRTGEPRDEPG